MTESQEIGSCNYLAECGFKLLAAASHPTLGTPPGLELDEQFQRLSYLLYILCKCTLGAYIPIFVLAGSIWGFICAPQIVWRMAG
jgi:hypothetical protein